MSKSKNKMRDKVIVGYSRRSADKRIENDLKIKFNKIERFMIKKLIMHAAKRSDKREEN